MHFSFDILASRLYINHYIPYYQILTGVLNKISWGTFVTIDTRMNLSLLTFVFRRVFALNKSYVDITLMRTGRIVFFDSVILEVKGLKKQISMICE